MLVPIDSEGGAPISKIAGAGKLLVHMVGKGNQ